MPNFFETIRSFYSGNLICNDGIDQAAGNELIKSKKADAVSFGTLALANPDLVERFRNGWEVAMPDWTTLFTPGPKGYTDYPTHKWFETHIFSSTVPQCTPFPLKIIILYSVCFYEPTSLLLTHSIHYILMISIIQGEFKSKCYSGKKLRSIILMYIVKETEKIQLKHSTFALDLLIVLLISFIILKRFRKMNSIKFKTNCHFFKSCFNFLFGLNRVEVNNCFFCNRCW